MPEGKRTEVALVILMDEDGNFGTYLTVPETVSPIKYPMPSSDTLSAIIRMLTFEWRADELRTAHDS